MPLVRRSILGRVLTGAGAVAMLAAGARADILSSKRGFADTGANYGNLQATGAGWYYTWGTSPASPGNYNAKFYPMFWSAPSQTTITDVRNTNPDYVLGFNEPERSDQANMTVAQAITSWTAISNSFAGTSTKLVSPAVADTGGSTGGQQWLASFMSQANAAHLKVDAVAFHWYDISTPSNPAGSASQFLSRVDSYHNSYGLPVFITEFAIHDWGNAYTDDQIIDANRQFLDIVIPGLESRSYVAGYSWYNWFSDAHLFGGTPPAPTPMAYSYVGAIGAGTTANISGVNLGEHVAYLTGGTLTMTGTAAGTLSYINALANTSNIAGSIDWTLAGSSSWVRIQPGATLRKTGSNRITFGARTITNNGILEIAEGVLRLSISPDGTGSINLSSTGGAIGSTARLELAGNISVASPITFAQRNDPAGSDGIRNVSGNNTLAGPLTIVVGGNQARIQSDSGQLTLAGAISTSATSARNLYLQGAGNGRATGAISDNASDLGGVINLHKEGTGSWTLSGANTYSGVTTVAAGTLVAGLNAQAPILTNAGGADIQGGRLIFDYIGGASPATTVQGILTDSYAAGFSSGQIRSSTANSAIGLGWSDDGLSQLTVAPAYYGDANLDGKVDTLDFNALAANFGGSGKVWTQADFDYDGVVDTLDFNNLAANFGQQLADVAGGSTAALVPEPAGGLTFLLCSALLLARRSRNPSIRAR